MRLWSIHPHYLDPAGLVALWREALLAQKVLAGETKGYRHHPQLDRFRDRGDAISRYLRDVYDEATRRGYAFDRARIAAHRTPRRLIVTRGQLAYEWEHLRAKLAVRNERALAAIDRIQRPVPHPLFDIVAGDVEDWERQRSPGEPSDTTSPALDRSLSPPAGRGCRRRVRGLTSAGKTPTMRAPC